MGLSSPTVSQVRLPNPAKIGKIRLIPVPVRGLSCAIPQRFYPVVSGLYALLLPAYDVAYFKR